MLRVFVLIALIVFTLILEKIWIEKKWPSKKGWLSLVLAIGLSAAWVYAFFRETYFYGDSPDYIGASPIRAPLYPLFLRWHIIRHSWSLDDWHLPETLRRSIVHTQLALIFIATSSLMVLIWIRRWWGPAVLSLGYLGFRLLGENWSENLNREIMYAILADGLKLSWFIALCALWVQSLFKPTRGLYVLLGFWAYVGIEINPNSLPLGLLTLAPLFVGLLKGLPQDLRKYSWVPFVIFISCYGARCLQKKQEIGVFSTVPFNGYTSIMVAFGFAPPHAEQLFEDPRTREFVRRMMLEPCRTKRRSPECRERSAFAFELDLMHEIFPEKQTHREINLVFSQVSSRLLSSDLKSFLSWQKWGLENLARGTLGGLFGKAWTALFLFLTISAIRGALKTRSPLAIYGGCASMVTIANAYLSTMFVVYEMRYVIYGQLLILLQGFLWILEREQKCLKLKFRT